MRLSIFALLKVAELCNRLHQGGGQCLSPTPGSPPPSRSIKLANLWESLPPKSQEEVVAVAARLLQARLQVIPKEVHDERSAP